jgi:hypothetical protein
MKSTGWIALAVSIISTTFAFLMWLNARKTIRNQTYLRLLEDYSSPRMLAAVQALTDLRTKCTTNEIPIGAAYRVLNRKDLLDYREAAPKDKPAILEASINNQRRVVSHFYYRLSSVLRTNVLPQGYIFRYWHAGGLRLIPDVISQLHLDDDKELDELYRKALDYRASRGAQTALYVCIVLFALICQTLITYFTFSWA